MKKKLLIGFLLALSLLFSSCYPELSVQQYDKLKEDLEALDVKRAELELQVESLIKDIESLKAEDTTKDAETTEYVRFLEKMISTQSSERLLTGEFDVESLINSEEVLNEMAEELGDSKVSYYLELFDSDNSTQTVAAYYKTIEYCFKQMKLNLQQK